MTPTQSARSFAALRRPGFRIFLSTSVLAGMADNIEHVISYWVMFQQFQSPALGGFAVISHWVPFLVFSVPAGALADRFDPRRLIQTGMVLFMITSLGWGVLFATDSLQMWHAMVLLVLHGCAGVFSATSSQILLHDIVTRDELPSAVRLNATSRYLGMLAGPAVGGALLLALGPALGIFVNVLFYAPLLLWLWKAPYGPWGRPGSAPVTRAVRGVSDLRQAMQEVAANPILLTMTLLAGAASFLIGNSYHAQMPEFAHDFGHGEPGSAYSLLLAADAAGALVAGILLESVGWLRPMAKTALVLATAWCLCLAAFAITPVFSIALVVLFLAGFFELSFSSMAQTLVQLNAPAEVRGRVIGFFTMAALGLRAFSGVVVGLAGSRIGIHVSLGVAAVAMLGWSAWLLTRFHARRPPS